MKKSVFSLLVLLLSFQISFAQFSYKNLNVKPTKANAKSKVEFTFDLSAEEDVFIAQSKVFAFVAGVDGNFEEIDVEFTTKDKSISGAVSQFPADATTLVLVVRDENYKSVSGEGKTGFVIPLHDKADKMSNETYVKAAIWELYYVQNEIDAEPNLAEAVKILDMAFEKEPKIKAKYASTWVTAQLRANKNTAPETFLSALVKMEKEFEKDGVALGSIANAYKILKKEDDYKRLGATVVSRFKDSEFALSRIAEDTFVTKQSVEAQFALVDYLKKYEYKTKYSEVVVQKMVIAYYQAGDFEKVEIILQKAANTHELTTLAYNIASRCMDKNMFKEAKMLNDYCTKAFANVSKKENKIPTISDAKFAKKNEMLNDQLTVLNALVLVSDEKFADALPILEKIYQKGKGKTPKINSNYVTALWKLGKVDLAKEMGEKAVSEAVGTSEIKGILKEIFMQKNKDEAAWATYLTGLEANAMDEVKAEMSKKLISEDAANFKLINLKGEEVELAALKGKVVILDFWATWCGPCIASFPAMQIAVDHFKNDPNVAFLFVNCWENVADKKTHVATFIEKRKQTFNVIFDLDAEVAKSYGVTGIPAKFFIDVNGKLRYKASGFSGNTDATVMELKVLVDLLKK